MTLHRRLSALLLGLTTLLQSVENTRKLEAELADLLARYKSAVDGAQAPIEAKFKDLDVRAQKDLVVVGESYAYAPWAVKEFNALRAQSNKSYETLCSSWWNATGPYHGWMKKYKDHLIKDEVPTREEADKVGVGFMVVLVGTPEKPYRSTAAHQATIDHLNRAVKLFTERWMRPGRDYGGN